MSTELVLSNVTVLEGEDLSPVHGYLVVKDGFIKKISEGSPSGFSKDMKESIIIPPFFNAHTHIGDSEWKELYIGRTQPEVVGPSGLKQKLLESSKEEELISAMRTSMRAMLRYGTIGFCDFREGGLKGLKILKRAIIPPLKVFALGRGGSLQDCRLVLREADGIGAPSLDFLSWVDLLKISRETKRKGKIFSVHVSETLEAERESINRRGEGELSTAIKLLPSFLVHATHSGEELKKAKRRKIPIVFCPRANRLLSTGSPPISKALELGLEFWLGSDNVSVCEPNMFEVLRSAWECVRLDNPRADGEDARILLTAATVKPSKFFLGFKGIEEGGEATFLILARRENLKHLEDIFAGIVNRAGIQNIRGFFIKGRKN